MLSRARTGRDSAGILYLKALAALHRRIGQLFSFDNHERASYVLRAARRLMASPEAHRF